MKWAHQPRSPFPGHFSGNHLFCDHHPVCWSYTVHQVFLLYLPTQICFLIGRESVTCHGLKLTNSLGWTKLTNSLGKPQLELSTCTWSGRTPLKLRQICEAAGIKQTISSQHHKTLNDWPRRKQWVLFPLDLNVPHGFASGNTEGLRETKLTVSLGASH